MVDKQEGANTDFFSITRVILFSVVEQKNSKRVNIFSRRQTFFLGEKVASTFVVEGRQLLSMLRICHAVYHI